MRFISSILTTGILLVTLIRPAHAEDPVAAERADEQARAYFKVNAFEEAAKEFLRAFELEQKPTRLFNAALAFEKAGNLRDAAKSYEQFLALEKDGPKLVEARARKIAVDKLIAEEEERAKAASAREAHDKEVRALAEAATELLSSGSYEEAAAEFEKTYELSKDAEYLFDKAEALRLGRKSTDALAAYHRYLRISPDGDNALIARQHRTELEQALLPPVAAPPAPREAEKQSVPPASLEVQKASSPPPAREQGVSWSSLAIGVGAIAGGVALDLIPRASKNGEVDPSDFVPVALYGIGAAFVYAGVF